MQDTTKNNKLIAEKDILEILEMPHTSDLQSKVYCNDLRHLINATDVINSIKLIYKMGFKVVKDDK